jgi:uncharacterized GH25 family protein
MSKKKMLSVVGLVVALSLVVLSSTAYACWPWINVTDYTMEPESKPTFYMALGHRFPLGHSFISYDKTAWASIEEVYMLSLDGAKLKVQQRVLEDGTRAQVQFEAVDKLKSGTHLLVLQTTRDFRKPSGTKHKAEIPTLNHMWAKAIVNIGESGGSAFKKVLGHGLEIVPLKDPADLRVNDYLPVKIFLNGEPLKSTWILATYMGFSADSDVFAYTAKSSENGTGEIRILQPGIWRIRVDHKGPAPDPKKTGAEMLDYRATLTFEVR